MLGELTVESDCTVHTHTKLVHYIFFKKNLKNQFPNGEAIFGATLAERINFSITLLFLISFLFPFGYVIQLYQFGNEATRIDIRTIN